MTKKLKETLTVFKDSLSWCVQRRRLLFGRIPTSFSFASVFNNFFLFLLLTQNVYSGISSELPKEVIPRLSPEEIKKKFDLAMEESKMFVRESAKRGNFEPELEKILQCGRPFKTISISYKVETSSDNGNTWKPYSENRLIWNKEKNLSYFSSKQTNSMFMDSSTAGGKQVLPSENIREIFFDDGIQTLIMKDSYQLPTGKNVRKSSVKIKKTVRWLDAISDSLINYMNIGEKTSLFEKDSFSFYKPVMTKTIYRGKPAIKVENCPMDNRDSTKSDYVPKKTGRPDMVVIFDAATGMLLEKSYFGTKAMNEHSSNEPEIQTLVEEYFHNNGLYFPKVLTFRTLSGDRTKIRFIVDKDTTKLNEILDKQNFIPAIPPQSEVFDEIKGTRYIAPTIGNIGAEKQIAKELDELFKEATK